MSKASQGAKKPEMTPHAQTLLNQWQRTRPNLIEQLQREGSLEEYLNKASSQMLLAEQTMLKKGMDRQQVQEEIDREYLHLVDL